MTIRHGHGRKRCFFASGTRGMSLVEVMIVIGVLAVIASILIPAMVGIVPGSKAATAEANLEYLNQAVLKFNHASTEITNAVESGGADEQAVFATLQARDATLPGSPFLGTNFRSNLSNTDTTYRASWNGRMFQLVSPGSAGTGLDLLLLQ